MLAYRTRNRVRSGRHAAGLERAQSTEVVDRKMCVGFRRGEFEIGCLTTPTLCLKDLVTVIRIEARHSCHPPILLDGLCHIFDPAQKVVATCVQRRLPATLRRGTR